MSFTLHMFWWSQSFFLFFVVVILSVVIDISYYMWSIIGCLGLWFVKWSFLSHCILEWIM